LFLGLVIAQTVSERQVQRLVDVTHPMAKKFQRFESCRVILRVLQDFEIVPNRCEQTPIRYRTPFVGGLAEASWHVDETLSRSLPWMIGVNV
jgi:hypothetical protein